MQVQLAVLAAAAALVIPGCDRQHQQPVLPRRESHIGAVRDRAAEGPRAEVSKQDFTFRLRRGEDLPPGEVKATIRNAGQETLVLSLGGATCACAVPELSAQLVRPNESAEVRLRLGSDAYLRPRTDLVSIHTNDPNSSVLRFKVCVDWIEPIRLIPPTGALDFGEVRRGDEKVRTFAIVQEFGDVPLTLLDLTSTVPGLTLTGDVVAWDDVRTIDVTAKFVSGNIAGPVNGEACVFTSVHEEGLRLPVAALITGDLCPEPGQVYFGRMRPGSTRHREIRVAAEGDSQASIERLETSSPGLTFTLCQEPNASVLNLECHAPDSPGTHCEWVMLESRAGICTRIPVIIEIVGDDNSSF
ncbi:MAG: DUF1573 domain-containing protein [Candidatus Hydrogenedentes bacterium]|nr:DUF1573 domain-containing protein [Candidatus Hydrogenedentota bacterium]